LVTDVFPTDDNSQNKDELEDNNEQSINEFEDLSEKLDNKTEAHKEENTVKEEISV
jgi:hypothetical protein